MNIQTKRILTIMTGMLAVAALKAATDCYGFFGYGQSTMDAPATVLSGFSGYIDGQTLTVTTPVTGSGGLVVGAPLAATGIVNIPTTVISAFGTGTGQQGTYTVNNAQTLGSAGTPVVFSVCVATDDFKLVTATNVTPNAYMIADPLNGPRPMWESLTVTNSNSEAPVSTAFWNGFTPLHELAAAWNYGYSRFYIETPMSGFIAQFAAGMGGSPTGYAMVAANVARGSADWNTTTLQLKPGSPHWANLRTVANYIKNGIQSSSNALANNPGPLRYRTGGMVLRLGETAAAGGYQNAAAAFTASDTTISMSGTAPATLAAGWQVYDGTKGAWVGTVQSWIGTSLVLQAPAATASSGSSDQLRFSTGQAGFFSGLREMVAQWSAADLADSRNAPGAPIFAAHPSSSNFTVTEATYGFHIALAYVQEALVDRRFVLAGPSFPGRYQSDSVHQQSDGNALIGSYIGQWAAWWYQGKRTAPFIMTAATLLTPSQCDGTHYGVRVTFAMPPTDSPAQQTLQFYTDSKIPHFANYGFTYTDGAIVFDHAGASVSGITIAASPFLAANNTYLSGAANQVDIPLSGDPSSATHPTISIGAAITPNGVTINGLPNAHLFAHNIADSCTNAVALPGLVGKAFGAGGNQLVNFASACAIEVGQTLAPAW